MSYLARLRRENPGKGVPGPLTELTKGASVSSVSTYGRPFPEIEAAESAVIIQHDGTVPERWAEMLRGLAVEGVRWDLAADALESLMDCGAIERALILGWHPLELIGVQRIRPPDHPSRAGLIFSMRPGDTIPDVRDSGCIIAYGNVRHIWKRTPLPADDSICLPWEIRA